MKIVGLHFYLLVCCGAAEGFTEKSVDLGQNVTLDCDVSPKHVLWFLMKPSEPPMYILRSFASMFPRAEYSNKNFSKTFSVQYNSTLFIHNISTNELGVYYCIQTGSSPNISSGVRLYLQNHSAENQTRQGDQQQDEPGDKCEDVQLCRLWRSLFIVLGIINGLVIVVVLTVRLCERSSKTQAQPPDAGLQERQDNPDPVYDVVQYSPENGRITTTNINSTYALLQVPNAAPAQTTDLSQVQG